MEQVGYIKLHRVLLKNPICKNPRYAWLWVVLLLKANHEPHDFLWNNQVIVIKAGQFLTGRKQLAEESGVSESTIEDILTFFEKQQQIQQQKTTKFRIITILNWDKYQMPTSKATTKQQQSDTYKNEENEKKHTASDDFSKAEDFLKHYFIEYKKLIGDNLPKYSERIILPKIEAKADMFGGYEKLKKLLAVYFSKREEFYKDNKYSLTCFLSENILNKLS